MFSQAVPQKGNSKNVFYKYIADLQENDNAKVWFQ